MPPRALGNTGIDVTALGFGAGHVGGPEHDDREVESLLNRVLDLGIRLVDTARGYGQSEERIGKYLAHRRSKFVLSSKVGYGIPGHEDWSGPIISAGVAAALRRLRTDYLDIVHLHSCPREILERGEVITALDHEVRAGRVRAAAYSGENEALAFAVGCGRFSSIQCSVNIADQWALNEILPAAAAKGLGVIAKRPLANAPWRFRDRPRGHYCEEYWTRLQQMRWTPGDMTEAECALRFSAFAPGVHSAIVGTRNLDHLAQGVRAVNKGPLPADQTAAIRSAFREQGRDWQGQT